MTSKINRQPASGKRIMTHEEWSAEGTRLFGEDMMRWAFVCPACGHVATAQDWKDAGAPEGAVAFSCVGRWAGAQREAFGEGDGPCNYAGGGLFGLNPIEVDKHRVFAFASLPVVDSQSSQLDSSPIPSSQLNTSSIQRTGTQPGANIRPRLLA